MPPIGLPPIISPYINPLTNRSPTPDSVVADAAKAHGVDPAVLLGVWGMETGFGSNVKTSSAGAIGDFQFLPSTAHGRGYPLTNTPTSAQFAQQANAAAAYIAELTKAHGGDVNAALQAYSGGGYGLAEVQAKAKGHDAAPTSVVGKTAKAISDTLSVPAQFLAFLTSAETWIRMGEAISGLVLIYFGLKQLTGG